MAVVGLDAARRSWPQQALIALVRAYRWWLKPWLGSACRFEPSCSAFALQALERHGALRGAALTGGRLLRCHPYCDGGCDPVPEVPSRAVATSLVQRRSESCIDVAAEGVPTRKLP